MIIEVEESYYKHFYSFLQEVEPELRIEEDVDTYIYDLIEIADRYEKKATRNFLKINVLPAVAIYKALLEHREEKDALRLIGDYISRTESKNVKTYRGKGLISRLLGCYNGVLYREMNRRKEGWKITWLYHTRKETACNVQECLIASVLNELECARLIPVLCEHEHRLMKSLHNGHFSCNHTIGNGDDFCDFVFEEKL